MLSKFSVIQIFLPGDVLLKQGDQGSKFHIVIEGFADVVRENKDISMRKFKEMASKEE